MIYPVRDKTLKTLDGRLWRPISNGVYPRVILAGIHSGVGKTTLSLGIMSALRKKGLKVQPFKTGPDYIDPSYHTQAAGQISRNLDSWLLSKDTILELFVKQAESADISIIEGVMGLYDGLADTEEGSTAQLSKILKCPVILILDARSLSRSAAAICLGYMEFDKKVDIKGVIINNIGSDNHYRYIKSATEKKTGIPVIGYLPRSHDLKLPERHLGLVPAPEKKLLAAFYRKLSNLINQHIDLDKIISISRKAQPLVRSDRKEQAIFSPKPVKNHVTIAVAFDEAFNFYYRDNLDILESFGARLVKFSPLGDDKLPKGVSGVYIGGGFPELFAARLSANKKLKRQIRQQAEEGLPIYAECGGLMYFMERIADFNKNELEMVGLFKGSVNMGKRLQALGYVKIEAIKDNILSKKGTKTRGHVFHWSYLDNLPDETSFAYKIEKNKDRIFYDGLIQGNVLASYVHLHFASDINFAKNFINKCRQTERRND